MREPGSSCLILRCERPAYAPSPQDFGKLLRDEKACACVIVALSEEVVVIREDVAHIGDEGEPCRAFGGGNFEAGAAMRMIEHRFEFMRRELWGEHAQCTGDLRALAHAATITPVLRRLH